MPPSITYRRDQLVPLTCEQLDANFEALSNRVNHVGTQLASTIPDLRSTVEGYSFIQALQQCCVDLNLELDTLQGSILDQGDFSVLINNLRNELLQDISDIQEEVDLISPKIATTEASIATLVGALAGINTALSNLNANKANINSPTLTGVPKAPTPSPLADDNQIATVGFVKALTEAAQISGVPIGSLIAFTGAAIPTLWLPCRGQTVSRVTHAALFAVIGTMYGAGDGSTTFTLPRMDQAVPVGVGTHSSAPGISFTLGSTGGQTIKTLQVPEMPSHQHNVLPAAHVHSLFDPGHTHSMANYRRVALGNGQRGDGAELTEIAGGSNTHPFVVGSTSNITVAPALAYSDCSSTGSSQAFSLMSPFVAVNYIIKAF